jgi:ABC-type uncharacterized transport system substrate-binding protein
MTLLTPDLAGERLELLREMVPQLRRLAVMANVAYSAGGREIDDTQAAARTIGIEITPFEIRRAEDIAPAFERRGEGRQLDVGDAQAGNFARPLLRL